MYSAPTRNNSSLIINNSQLIIITPTFASLRLCVKLLPLCLCDGACGEQAKRVESMANNHLSLSNRLISISRSSFLSERYSVSIRSIFKWDDSPGEDINVAICSLESSDVSLNSYSRMVLSFQ